MDNDFMLTEMVPSSKEGVSNFFGHHRLPPRILNGLLSDVEIESLCTNADSPMIAPFVNESVKVDANGNRVVSYGLSSYGYDIRLAPEFLIFTNATQSNHAYVDPKDFDENCYVRHEGDSVIIPPNGFVLARTVEYFKVPKNVTGVVLGKSTYARVGLSCLATPLEPGWEGQLVLEFANLTPRPLKMYANEGCAQVLWYAGTPCRTSYADRAGKYQGQMGITLPKV
jgi:dCTP deaminase